MHEMSLCESLIDVIEESGQRENFSRVRRVRVEIGRFAGVEVEALRFGFDVVARGTVVEGAALELHEAPGRAWCFDCGTDVELLQRLDPCPHCGGTRLQPTGGTEIRIMDLEVI
ncbi:hydrogenase maturation nickel metallochaperone HypA [Komagataeibacter melaceti]|uniref:Hydrogenase maturation factor HypA n=1 Tax=Komagataeibacter melaceti TaxID=2766577 RepID=A0A371Z4F8_9PROT|nr:hydrogenase maturation nickel metallochaperone HypA [Komagataeibacter melaceti]RFD21351.1 hydrogenase maturation nickel metallochaperone HypA [Komagataeibacter melaceti]